MKRFPCMQRGQAFPLRGLLVGFVVVIVCPGFVWLFLTSSIVAGTQTLVAASGLPWAQTSWGICCIFKSLPRICWHVPYKRPDLQIFEMVLHWPSLTNLQALCFVGVTCQMATWKLMAFTSCFSTFEWGSTLKKFCCLPIVLLLKADLSCCMQVLYKVIFSYNRCYRCYTHCVKQVLSNWFQGAVIQGEHKVFPWLQKFITRKLLYVEYKLFFFINVTQEVFFTTH